MVQTCGEFDGVGDEIDDGIVRVGVEVAPAVAAVVGLIASVPVAVDVSIKPERQFQISLRYCPSLHFGSAFSVLGSLEGTHLNLGSCDVVDDNTPDDIPELGPNDSFAGMSRRLG